MSCNHPLTAFLTGVKTDKGMDDYVIGKEGDKVFRVDDALKRGHSVDLSKCPNVSWQGYTFLTDPTPIPCGHCVGCRMDRAKDWKVRCVLESVSHRESWFVTLTYDDRHLPTSRLDGCPVLRKDDLQGFFKRLRYYFGDQRFRYFACGEYGENTLRPHYHFILFCDRLDAVQAPDGVIRSDWISSAWTFGLVDIKKADVGCMAYVAGYVEKKQKDPHFDEYRKKPFILMSRRPGLGLLQLNAYSVVRTGKVYGDFGSCNSAAAPRLFLEKVRDDPMFDDLHQLRMFCGKAITRAYTDYFGTSPEVYGHALDQIKRDSLKDKRKPKL